MREMQNKEKKTIEKNINDIARLSPLFLVSIIFYNKFIMLNNSTTHTNKESLEIIFTGTIVCTVILIFTLLYIYKIKYINIKYEKLISIVEVSVYTLLFTVIILQTNTYLSEYKYIFLLVIIISTIQSGLKFGVITSIISSIVILGVDLVFYPSNGVNKYFENDLILSGVFVLTAWVLGSYVKDNRKNMIEKEEELKRISNELKLQKKIVKLEKDIEKNVQLLNETREYNKLITEFFSNISHELKTPLHVIFSAVQTLDISLNKERDEFVTLQKRYQKIMKQNCFRLLRLINNLLDVTKIDSGYMKLNDRSCNIVDVVEEITQSVVDFAEAKGINIIFDTNVEEKNMAVDVEKIERIILNLLSNAIKFTDKGGEIKVMVSDKEKDVVISIKDNGVGIPKDKLELIFERFGQVDKTLKRNHEGTGIGLSLVKSLVEMHNGTIEVHSNEDIGSEFVVCLPAKISSKDITEGYALNEGSIEKIKIELSDISLDYKLY